MLRNATNGRRGARTIQSAFAIASPPGPRDPQASSRLRWLRSTLARSTSLASLIVFLGVWEAGVRLFNVQPYILPPPSAVFAEIFQAWSQIWPATLTTLREVVIGYSISAVVAIVLGALIASWKVFDRAVMPLIVGTNAIPLLSVAPLLLVWFGTGNLPKVLLVVLATFFPILITTNTGLRAVDRNLVLLFHSVGASKANEIFKLRLPYAIPHIFSGLQVATSLSVVAAMISEWLSSSNGLGYLLIEGTNAFRTTLIFASIFMLVAMSLIFYNIVSFLARRVSWSTQDFSTAG